MRYDVLDDIAYEVIPPLGAMVTSDAPKLPKLAVAAKGDVVELTSKDAAALLKRGAVRISEQQ